MDIKSSDLVEKPLPPSPATFELFLPWACDQLQVDDAVIVTKINQTDYVSVVAVDQSKTKKLKHKLQSKAELTPDPIKDDKSFTLSVSIREPEPGIQISAFYDSNENLVHLKFERNRRLPRIILKLIGMIINFHHWLNTITINAGLDQYCVYEICKFLPFSNVTELCLDNTFVEQANYHILLENANCLRHLSLARCSINDSVVEEIVSKLHYPLPASNTLSILNLSSNQITDLGAQYISEALKTNRQLSYLNVSSNMITDEGAQHILNTLLKFPLTFAELLASRSRHMNYLKRKNDLILMKMKDLQAFDVEKRLRGKRSSARPASNSTPKKEKRVLDKEPSLKSVGEFKSYGNVEYAFLEKAEQMVEAILGEFKDPFDKSKTTVEDGIVYSHGNNSLCYLSMAYNNLTYVTLTKLLTVLVYQKKCGRKPRGLINVSIEGNFLPAACRELQLIDDILDTGLVLHTQSTTKKRAQSKSGR